MACFPTLFAFENGDMAEETSFLYFCIYNFKVLEESPENKSPFIWNLGD